MPSGNRQTITWSNDGPDLYQFMASLGPKNTTDEVCIYGQTVGKIRDSLKKEISRYRECTVTGDVGGKENCRKIYK